MADNVNHPAHYMTDKGIETIDVIEAFTSNLLGIEAVCTANVIKYICRWKKKNGIEDLKKAQWYLTRLIDHMEEKHKQTETKLTADELQRAWLTEPVSFEIKLPSNTGVE